MIAWNLQAVQYVDEEVTARMKVEEEEVVEEKEVNKKRCLEQRHLRAGGHTAHTHLRRGSRTNLQVVNTTAAGSEVSRGEKKI